MLIANPIYDVVFKRLMENDKVAKFLIGTLLEQTIETLEVKPQEFTYVDDLSALAVYRLDFLATVKTDTGELKKVLIEIQKARNNTDLMRFRNYLAEQYKKEDVVDDQKVILPITTIYILGFKLPEIETPCLKVERQYKDLVLKQHVIAKSDFVENLTHDSYIVQVERITGRYQTRLDKLLSIFEQKNFADDKKLTKLFNHPADTDEIKEATNILHYSGTDPEEKKKIEIEQEAWRTFAAMLDERTNELQKNLVKAQKALSEKDQALSEKDQALSEKDQVITDAQKALSEKDQAILNMQQELAALKRQLGEE
jgi:hypothetical protein